MPSYPVSNTKPFIGAVAVLPRIWEVFKHSAQWIPGCLHQALMDAPVAILTIVTLEHGGAQRQLIELAKYLSGHGWEVFVCLLSAKTAMIAELQAANIPVHILHIDGFASIAAGALRFARLIRKTNPAAIIGFAFHANLLVKLLGKTMRCPKVITSIRSVEFGGRVRDFLERITFHLSDATVVNSFGSAASLERRGVIPAGRSVIIRNAIAYQFPRSPPAAAEPSGPEKLGVFHWLALGRLDQAKDYPSLLRAIKTLKDWGCKVSLRIAGEGLCRGELENQIKELNLGEQVLLLGHTQDIAEQFAWADAVVMSSLREGLPNAIIEAMYFRKTVVATAVGGVPELLRGEAGAYVVPPGQPILLAEAMQSMMRMSARERAKLGETGREFVMSEFDLEKIMSQWITLLQKR
jgi:glycosyltransferase involved in cell wall biosynthesis